MENEILKSDFKIDIEKPKLEFEHHLQLDNNKRIIFSGGFGSGKTYFLREFFNENEKYEAIHLFPINYAVQKSEDIFELIKYDILLSISDRIDNSDYKHIDEKINFGIQFFSENSELFYNIIEAIPTIGKSITSILKLGNDFKKITQKYKSDHKILSKNINLFLNSFKNFKGSIYEQDIYTELIKEKLQALSQTDEEGKTKETVLIIDDLDRIDPEHIFRLLNVFSAHFDIEPDKNKFGFDKIIFVCDLENIRKIFHAKYGQDVDFSGYIDKFYSNNIFNYNLVNELESDIVNFLKSIKIDISKINNFNLYNTQDFIHQYHRILLKMLIISGELKVKQINRLYGSEIAFSRKNLNNHILSSSYTLDLSIEFLLKIFGSFDSLINSIHKCKTLYSDFIIDMNKSDASLEMAVKYFINNILTFFLKNKYARLYKVADDSNTQTFSFLRTSFIYKEYSFIVSIKDEFINIEQNFHINNPESNIFMYFEDILEIYKRTNLIIY